MASTERIVFCLRIAWITLAALALCCACTETEEAKKSSPPKRPSTHTDKLGPRKEVPSTAKAPEPSIPDKRLAALAVKRPSTAAGPGDKPTTPHRPSTAPLREPIAGYQTPAEYFTIHSTNSPQGTVAVTLPSDYYANPAKKYPLVIAFGGAGECAKASRQGALAWLGYYKMDEAITALKRGKLAPSDFRDLILPDQLQRFNERIKERPYQGMIIACPSSPLVWAAGGPEFPEYEEYIMNELIPALTATYRVADGRVGVDGVSMGGARAMYYGLKYPEVFASIGSSQGAFTPYMDLYAYLADTNKADLLKRPIQLVTSDKDVLRPAVEKMHAMLKEKGIPHEYFVLKGPHDYIFNQGPGVISLLVFHDESLHARARLQ